MCPGIELDHSVQKKQLIARLELVRLDVGDLCESAWREFAEHQALHCVEDSGVSWRYLCFDLYLWSWRVALAHELDTNFQYMG